MDIKNHNTASPLLVNALDGIDGETDNMVQHRALKEIDASKLENYMLPKIKKQHIDDAGYKRKKEILAKLKKEEPSSTYTNSPFPHVLTTRKCNYAEIFMGEYLQEVTSAMLPIYRLRYNPNPEQSMKGDDVLLFDLDSTPKRIIVGESKFRNAPTKKVVEDIIEGLLKSKKRVVPVSLGFVADRLRNEGKDDLADKIDECEILAVKGKLTLDYVGVLMSDERVAEYVDSNAEPKIHNLLMISVALTNPEETVLQAFNKTEAEYERFK